MKLLKNTWKNRSLVLMSLPALILIVMFSYIPMFGLCLAFKKFDFSKGLWDSPWCGFANFRYLFMSRDTVWRITRNTIGYYLLFTVVGTVLTVLLAIAIFECYYQRYAKALQSCMILPTFISWVAVSYIVKSFLMSESGLVNQILISLGGENIPFYLEAKYWPFILLIVNIWKGTGFNSVMYLAALSGIDRELYEAADLDGATARQKMRYITIPMLIPMIVILTLLGLGGILHSDTGLFYQVTGNNGSLYSTTQVLDSFILNGMMGSNDLGMTSAASFFQSMVGFVMVVGTNLVVRKIAPENAIF